MLSACIVQAQTTPAQTASANVGSNSKKADYTIKILSIADGGYGYDIYSNHKRFIHQPIIPGIAGNNGFTTKEDAQKVSHAVVLKMQNGEAMPAVSVQELKKLRIALPSNRQ